MSQRQSWGFDRVQELNWVWIKVCICSSLHVDRVSTVVDLLHPWKFTQYLLVEIINIIIFAGENGSIQIVIAGLFAAWIPGYNASMRVCIVGPQCICCGSVTIPLAWFACPDPTSSSQFANCSLPGSLSHLMFCLTQFYSKEMTCAVMHLWSDPLFHVGLQALFV